MKPRGLRIVFGVVKTLAIALGFVLTVISLMSLIGAITANGWARSFVAVAVALAVPAVIADRVRPKDDILGALGLPSDVFAVFLLGVGVAFLAVPSVSRPMLLREGDRQAVSGAASIARLTYFLAGVKPTPIGAPTPASGPTGSATAPAAPPASASTSVAADAGATARDAGAGARAERSPADLFRELAPAVVTIVTKGSGEESGGTGFFLDGEGTVATNHHVISGADEARIKLFSGTWVETKDVEVLADDLTNDLALLRIRAKETLKAVDLGDSDGVTVGEHVISIGNPLGLEHTLTDGLVSARRMYEGRAFIQMSAPVSPGNSGGPLFNMRGDVIGVTTAQVAGGLFGRAQNLNLAVPVNQLKSMIKSDYPDRHRFGKDAAGGSTW
jgi:serine protease Do